MATIDDLYQAFSQLQVKEQIPDILVKNEYPLIVKILDQHKQGKLASNQSIEPYYASKYYANYKAALNPVPGLGVPDGHVTGNYDDNMHITASGDQYEVESTVDYATAQSLQQYGNDFNLPNDQHKEEYWQETLAPEILNYIRETTGI